MALQMKKKLQRMHSNRNANGTNKYASMTTDEIGMVFGTHGIIGVNRLSNNHVRFLGQATNGTSEDPPCFDLQWYISRGCSVSEALNANRVSLLYMPGFGCIITDRY